MAKKIQGYIRLQLPAGAANPAPPVGPALGAQGVNIMAFCKDFNARTKDQNGMILPVVITVFSDKSFTFILKSPPASVLLKKAANIASGSGKPNQDKVGKVTKKQLLEIYNIKKADMNAKDPDAGIKVRVIVFTEDAPKALAAGADEAGLQDLMKKITEGWLDFDVAIATNDAMKQVRTLARVLGPKGLMPNPK